MLEGWDRRTMAAWVLGLGVVLVLIACVFLFYVMPRVVGG